MAAIFGPSSPHTRGIVASIAAHFDIPHLEYVWREQEKLYLNEDENLFSLTPMTINIYPDSEMVSKVKKMCVCVFVYMFVY